MQMNTSLLAQREFMIELYHKWRERHQFFALFCNDVTFNLNVLFTLIFETLSNFKVDLLFYPYVFDM